MRTLLVTARSEDAFNEKMAEACMTDAEPRQHDPPDEVHFTTLFLKSERLYVSGRVVGEVIQYSALLVWR